MGKKYWLALANLIWLGCWPASMVHASTEQTVVASPSIQHDWYQNEVAEQARHELEQQLQEAVLAQLHPDFYRLWQQLQKTPADRRGALYDEAFGKLARFQQAWRGMDLVAREQMQTLKLDLNRPWPMPPGRQSAGAGQATQATGGGIRRRARRSAQAAGHAHGQALAHPLHVDPAGRGELDRARPDPLHPERTGGQCPNSPDSLYDPETEQAIKQFQRRHGLTADGIIGRQTRSWLNTGPEVRASLLVRNLWRRDLVDHLAGRYVLVNIPDYRLSVVESGSEVFTSRVIVGKEQRATPILASEIRSIVLNPAWHVPRSILSKDILPKLGRDPAYGSRTVRGDRRRGQSGAVQRRWLAPCAGLRFPLPVAAKAGDHNALGRYKFYLPNNDAIYLHSTPRKALFEQGARAFSSGCIRVEHADDLAELLLADSRYQPDKVASILKETQTKWLPLSNPIPVFTVYWSSWIDEEGRQQLRNDIYGFDRVSYQSRLL